jgi:hypothetical protein
MDMELPTVLAIALSRHAQVRANQRGVTHRAINDLIAHADIERPVGDGCTVLRISRRRLDDPSVRAELGSNGDKLASLAVIWNGDRGQVVTLLIDHGRGRGRRYHREG